MNQQIRSDRKTFFLIDGSSYIYRAFYAIRRLTNSKGMATQAVYGFITMLQKVVRERKPDYVCVVFDAPGRNFRHDLFDLYKATRQASPEELGPQIPYIKKVVRYFGVSQMELEGYEADDLIATLTYWGSAHGLEIVVVSGDKDLMQLVRPGVVMLDAMKAKKIGRAEVIEKFGVPPEKVVDVQSLAGDSTDNVPGVPGIGVKTAAELINEYGDLDTLLARASEIKQPKRREKLIEFADQALQHPQPQTGTWRSQFAAIRAGRTTRSDTSGTFTVEDDSVLLQGGERNQNGIVR